MTAIPKAKVWQSEKYRRFVASLECCAPNTYYHDSRETVVPHHTEGKGQRKRDDLTIPLCHRHHNKYHDWNREEFEKVFMTDVADLIEQTQAAWLAAGNKAEWEEV